MSTPQTCSKTDSTLARCALCLELFGSKFDVQYDHMVNNKATWPGHGQFNSKTDCCKLCFTLTDKEGVIMPGYTEMNYTRATHGTCNNQAYNQEAHG